MQDYKSDPQMVADGVLALVNMKAGTRPYQTPINPISQEIEQEVIDLKLPIKEKWLNKLGWAAS